MFAISVVGIPGIQFRYCPANPFEAEDFRPDRRSMTSSGKHFLFQTGDAFVNRDKLLKRSQRIARTEDKELGAFLKPIEG